ncbi:Activating transcription factor 7-interacting like protein [Argiope bruennichi]|uniref:Activating transcription factor 7-interacting like protein n=1 Tax=Argiope bruennichi TaxID=94029 RepID=A0A8T0FAV4_ARGBR|nr:Activating transcription factor 7-interacting like protein [Argiope bruennichi]
MTETLKKKVMKGKKKAFSLVDDTEPKEEKMDVDTETIKAVDEGKEYIKPLVLKVEPECEDLVKLVVEGIETGNDDDEEFVIMTPEEIRDFLEQKISEQVRDPEINPLLELQKRSQDLLDEIKCKAEEISTVGKSLDTMYKHQVKFLRHVDVFPKMKANNVSVSVDLPLLMDSVPLGSTYKAQGEEAVINIDLTDAKIMSPSVSKTAPGHYSEEAVINKDLNDAKIMIPSVSKTAPGATPVTPNSTPTVPSAISITPIVPNANTTTSAVPNTSVTASAVPNTSATASAVPKTPTSNLTTTVKSLPKLSPKPTGAIECIDLTDDAPSAVVKPVTNSSPLASISLVKHPAPLPPRPFSTPNSVLPNVPPKPRLKVSTEERGIVLQWDMPPSYSPIAAAAYSKLKAFEIFGYQEQKNIVINTLLWKKIGSVKAMSLPMACTLTQFVEGQKYHFAIRAVDIHDRFGAYSDPISIVYKPV